MSYDSYESELTEKYVGKKVVIFDIEDELSNYEYYEWENNCSEDGSTESNGGSGFVQLNDRPYMDSDDDQDDDDYYDERREWTIQTGLFFTVNDERMIESIEIAADISCFGDSGLGECNPEDEWTDDDFLSAQQFLNTLTMKPKP